MAMQHMIHWLIIISRDKYKLSYQIERSFLHLSTFFWGVNMVADITSKMGKGLVDTGWRHG